MNLKNKKAGGKYLSIWWFFVVVIVAVGIIIGTFMFFGKDIDLRRTEADVLNARILGCLVSQGQIDNNFLEGNFDIFEKCGLNREIIDSKDSKYFIKIELDKEGFVQLPVYGDNFEKSCYIQSITKAEYFPRCIDNKLSVYDSEGNKLNLRVITGSNYYKL